jgi:hypothetical protein
MNITSQEHYLEEATTQELMQSTHEARMHPRVLVEDVIDLALRRSRHFGGGSINNAYVVNNLQAIMVQMATNPRGPLAALWEELHDAAGNSLI